MNVLAFLLAIAAIILFWVKPLQWGLTVLVLAWIVQLIWPAHHILIH